MEIKKGMLVYSKEVYYLYRRKKHKGPISEGVGIVVEEIDAEWVKVQRARNYTPAMKRSDLIPLFQLPKEVFERIDDPRDAFWRFLPEILAILILELQELAQILKDQRNLEKVRDLMSEYSRERFLINTIGEAIRNFRRLNRLSKNVLKI